MQINPHGTDEIRSDITYDPYYDPQYLSELRSRTTFTKDKTSADALKELFGFYIPEITDETLTEMYMKLSKEELVKMLIELNKDLVIQKVNDCIV